MIIIPADDIPATSEITGSERLGLPKIPRSNTQALAAINSITRILDDKVLANTGGVASGEYDFETIRSLQGSIDNLVATLATIETATVTTITAASATVASGEITELNAPSSNLTDSNIDTATIQTLNAITSALTDAVVQNLTAVTSSMDTATIQDLTAVVASLDTLTGQVATFNSLVSSNINADIITAKSGEFDTLTISGKSAQVFNNNIGEVFPNYYSSEISSHGANLTVSPDVLNYSMYIKDYIDDPEGAATLTTVDALVEGTLDIRTGESRYVVLDKGSLFVASNDVMTGVGYPKKDGVNLFTLELQNGSSELHVRGTEAVLDEDDIEVIPASIMAYGNKATFQFTFEAHQHPIA
jgi:hypothetical protein